jgi:hypothetical protein
MGVRRGVMEGARSHEGVRSGRAILLRCAKSPVGRDKAQRGDPPAVCETLRLEGITNSAAIHPSRDGDFSRLP